MNNKMNVFSLSSETNHTMSVYSMSNAFLNYDYIIWIPFSIIFRWIKLWWQTHISLKSVGKWGGGGSIILLISVREILSRTQRGDYTITLLNVYRSLLSSKIRVRLYMYCVWIDCCNIIATPGYSKQQFLRLFLAACFLRYSVSQVLEGQMSKK